MRFEKRSRKDGSDTYYSFVYYDSKAKKQRRLTREEVRVRFGKDVTSEAEARECLKLLEAKHETEKLRVQRRITWESEFYNFSALLSQYEAKQKQKAPNSWQNNVFYMRHYVLYYFLQERRLNNVELWSDHFEDFRSWLETAKKVRGKGIIAVSSRNHAIKALNTFMDHLFKAKLVAAKHVCDVFPDHLLNKRTLDDVIEPEEMEKVFQALVNAGHSAEALLFRFLYFSGMRFNEALCISLGDLFQGKIPNDFMEKKLQAYKIPYHGYIVSDGQFGGVSKSGEVLRLPFKGFEIISEKYNRVIPIIDKVLWNSLVEVAEEKFNKAPQGKDRRDILIFPNVDDTTATNRLKAAFNQCRLLYRSWHCCRHSRATYLIGATSDASLTRVWLGHKSERILDNYNHIYQQINRQSKANELTGKTFGLRKVT